MPILTCSRRPGGLTLLGILSSLLVLVAAAPARAQAPANDSCAHALALPVHPSCVVTIADNTGATASPQGSVPTGRCGGPPPDVWFSTIVPANGVIIVETSAVTGSAVNDTEVDLYSGTCGNLTWRACNDDIGPGNRFSRVQLTGLPAGTLMMVRVRSFGAPGQGPFGICATTDSTSACQAPVNVAITALTDSTATISFVPSISAPTSYTVTATPATGPAISTTVSAPPASLTGLIPGTTYTVSVVSNCPGGLTSSAATEVFTTTSPAMPCVPPSAVSAVNVTATGASITFTPAPGATNYVLLYQAVGGPMQSVMPLPTSAPITLSNLLPTTTYLFTLQAQCPAGFSTTSSGAFVTSALPGGGDECPDAVLLPVNVRCIPTLLTTAGATASSEPSPGCGGNTIIDVWCGVSVPANGILQVETSQYPGSPVNDTGLALYSGMCGNLTLLGCNDDIGGGNRFSKIRLTGLPPGMLVYARAWKWGAGAGERFYICATTDASTACAVPAALTATAVTDSSLTVDFDTTATASYYQLSYQLGTSAINIAGLAGPPFTITGLAPGLNYQVCVWGICATGPSTPSCVTMRTAAVVTGIDQATTRLSVEVFPNPAHQTVNVRVAGNTDHVPLPVSLSNSLGQVVRRQVLRSTENAMPLADLPPGIYQLHLTTPGGVVVKRLIVE